MAIRRKKLLEDMALKARTYKKRSEASAMGVNVSLQPSEMPGSASFYVKFSPIDRALNINTAIIRISDHPLPPRIKAPDGGPPQMWAEIILDQPRYTGREAQKVFCQYANAYYGAVEAMYDMIQDERRAMLDGANNFEHDWRVDR